MEKKEKTHTSPKTELPLTKLELISAMAMQGILCSIDVSVANALTKVAKSEGVNRTTVICKMAIENAKELLKQLDDE